MSATVAQTWRPVEHFFTSYVQGAPLSHALYRAAEFHALRAVDLNAPVLDLGCGRGDFLLAALGRPVSVGIDLSPRQVRLAGRSAAYDDCREADARRVPLADDSCGTILSISVLEHIENPEETVREATRLLRPGGQCVMTMAIADLHDYLFYPRLLARLRLPWLAAMYRRLHDRVFWHRSLWTKDQWAAAFASAGLRVLTCRRIASPRLTRVWDAMLPLSAVERLLAASGLLRVWRTKRRRLSLWKKYRPLVEEECDQGSSLFIVAEKPGDE